MFDNKKMCDLGQTIRQGALINFVCSKTNVKCNYCRYCTHDKIYKMLPNSTNCELRNK